MGRIFQKRTLKFKFRKSKVKKNTSTRKRGNQKRCSKCGRFM